MHMYIHMLTTCPSDQNVPELGKPPPLHPPHEIRDVLSPFSPYYGAVGKSLGNMVVLWYKGRLIAVSSGPIAPDVRGNA